MSARGAGSGPAVEIEGLSYTYPARGMRDEPVAALKGVTLTVERGSRLGILGPNGGGKSTLVKLILGLLTPDAGAVRVLGRTAEGARGAGLVGYLPQRITAEVDWPVSVVQAVAMPLAARAPAWRLRDRASEAAALRALDLVGMADLARRPVGALSGGQLQRAMIARAVAGEPELLVLDEPTVGVDAAGQGRFADLIARLHAELGITIVTVSHDLRAVAAGSDRVACLRRTLHFHDAPSGLTPSILAEVFAHDMEAVFGRVHVDAHAAAACAADASACGACQPSNPPTTPPCGCDHDERAEGTR